MAEIVNKNPVNEPHSKPVKTHSKFNPNYSLYQTPNFGLNTPVLAMAGVGEDEISVRMNCDIDTFSLKAPTMTPIKRSLDYFYLPLRALLPAGAELLITNPLRGDDVVAKNVNAVILGGSGNNFQKFLGYLVSSIENNFSPTTPPTDDSSLATYLAEWFRGLQLGSRLLSKQSLAKQLGFSFDTTAWFVYMDNNFVPHYMSFDDIFDMFFTYLRTQLGNATAYDATVEIQYAYPTGGSGSTPSISVTSKYQLYGNIDYEGCASLDQLVYDLMNGDGLVQSVICHFDAFKDSSDNWINPFSSRYTAAVPTTLPEDLNVLRLLAYQKASAEFYTVDTVDDVYSAKLWEDNQRAFAYVMDGSYTPRYHHVNGVAVEYDACAGYYIMENFDVFRNMSVVQASSIGGRLIATWAYFVNLWSYTRSLRYQDYFVGSRVRPLAVGDVTVGVNNNVVDVVDVTKKIQVQRFLNQVNRVGRKFSDYMKGVLGSAPLPDAHEPLFLAHVVDTIGASEVTNTGSDQLTKAQTKTSNYRSNSSRYMFTMHVAEPGIIIGIQNYDIPRVYGTVTDRENYHVDRYDAFNPYMQFVGDQPVFRSELCNQGTQAGNFGYQQRYAEYKQRVSIASGGFLGYLPGYAKILDARWARDLGVAVEINSDFIRARMTDLDEFYVQRYVTSPANSFNFIVRNDAEITAKRPMAFAPSIL